MSLPSGVITCVLSTGSTGDFFGNDGTVRLDVTPVLGGNGQEITWAATGQTLVADTATSTAGAGSSAYATVPAVDQAGFVDSNNQATTKWSYRCVITVTVGSTTKTWTKNVQPLVSQQLIDLDLVPDGAITPATSAPFPPVISVNGQTGIVNIGGGAGDGGAVSSVAGRTGDVVLAKSDVGLGNVNNTTDAGKPISTATQVALDTKANDASVVHSSGGESIAGVKAFTASPTVPTPTTSAQAANKSYVDANAGSGTVPDASPTVKGVVQLTGALGGTAAAPTTPTAVHVSGAESISGVKTFSTSPVVPTPTTGTQAANKAYVDANAGTGGGSAVSSVAGRTGDVVLSKTDVGLANVSNTTDAAKPVSAATQTALDLKANDAQAVHLSGAESVSGVKTFAASPVVPTPTTGTQAATKAYVDANAGTAPDAAPTVKGIVQLTNDLGGTAAAPTTPTAVHVSGAESVSGVKTFSALPVIPTTTPSAAGHVASKSYVDATAAAGGADASTTTKGIVKLAGDLSGTALLPTVPGLAGKLTTGNNLSEIATAGSTAQTAAGKNIGILDVSGLIFDTLIPDLSASQIVSGTIGIANATPGSTITVFRAVGGAWPTRPTRRADVTVQWVGVAPAPAIDSTHAIAGVDLWQEDAS